MLRAAKFGLVLVAILLIGILFDRLHGLAPTRGRVAILFDRPGHVLEQMVAGIAHIPTVLVSLRSLQADRDHLADDVLRLSVENTDLREQLEVVKAEAREDGVQYDPAVKTKIGARVIGRDPDATSQYIQLDRGSRNGVKIGMAVTDNNVLLARITDVSASVSKALVISSHLSVVEARHEPSRTTAIVRGGLGGLLLDDMPIDVKLSPGERIVTSGLDGMLPPGLLIGTIDQITSEKASFLQTAKLKQPLENQTLEDVVILGRV